MQTDLRHPLPTRLHALAAMASLMERLDRTPLQASPAQYRGVAQQLTMLLEQAEPDEHLDALLRAAPATAGLYENMRYAQAGLCRSPLEKALDAELAAGAAITRARRRSTPG